MYDTVGQPVIFEREPDQTQQRLGLVQFGTATKPDLGLFEVDVGSYAAKVEEPQVVLSGGVPSQGSFAKPSKRFRVAL